MEHLLAQTGWADEQGRKQWVSDVLQHLRPSSTRANGHDELSHWFCDEAPPGVHPLVSRLFEALASGEALPHSDAVWREVAAQCAACVQCMCSYHATRRQLADEGALGTAAAALLLLEAAKRIEGVFAEANHAARSTPAAVGAATHLLERQPSLVLAICEVLMHDELLKDAGVNAELTQLILFFRSVGMPFDVTETGRLAGMVRLLGHHDQGVRDFAADMCRSLGPFRTAAEVFDDVQGLGDLLREWEAEVTFPSSPEPSDFVADRCAYHQQLRPLWLGIGQLLAMMAPPVVAAVFQQLPALKGAMTGQCGHLLRPGATADAALAAVVALEGALRIAGRRFFHGPQAATDASSLLRLLLDCLFVAHANLPAVHAAITTTLRALLSAILDLADNGGLGEEAVLDHVRTVLDHLLRRLPVWLSDHERRSGVRAPASRNICARCGWDVVCLLTASGRCAAQTADLWAAPLQAALHEGAQLGSSGRAADCLVSLMTADAQVLVHLNDSRSVDKDDQRAVAKQAEQWTVAPAVWTFLPNTLKYSATLPHCLHLAAVLCVALPVPPRARTSAPANTIGSLFATAAAQSAEALVARARQRMPAPGAATGGGDALLPAKPHAHALLGALQHDVSSTLSALAQQCGLQLRELCVPAAGAGGNALDAEGRAVAALVAMQCGLHEGMRAASARLLAALDASDAAGAATLPEVLCRVMAASDVTRRALLAATDAAIDRCLATGVDVRTVLCDEALAFGWHLQWIGVVVGAHYLGEQPDAGDAAAGRLVTRAWQLVNATLKGFVDDCPKDAVGLVAAFPSYVQARQSRGAHAERTLCAAMQLLATVWLQAICPGPSDAFDWAEQGARKLSWLEWFLAIAGGLQGRPDAAAVWEGVLFTMLEGLPRPIPWSAAVEARATALANASRLPTELKHKLASLQGARAPGTLGLLDVGTALGSLPNRRDAASNRSAAVAAVVDLTDDAPSGQSTPARPSSTPGFRSPGGRPASVTSPLAALWNQSPPAPMSADLRGRAQKQSALPKRRTGSDIWKYIPADVCNDAATQDRRSAPPAEAHDFDGLFGASPAAMTAPRGGPEASSAALGDTIAARHDSIQHALVAARGQPSELRKRPRGVDDASVMGGQPPNAGVGSRTSLNGGYAGSEASGSTFFVHGGRDAGESAEANAPPDRGPYKRPKLKATSRPPISSAASAPGAQRSGSLPGDIGGPSVGVYSDAPGASDGAVGARRRGSDAPGGQPRRGSAPGELRETDSFWGGAEELPPPKVGGLGIAGARALELGRVVGGAEGREVKLLDQPVVVRMANLRGRSTATKPREPAQAVARPKKDYRQCASEDQFVAAMLAWSMKDIMRPQPSKAAAKAPEHRFHSLATYVAAFQPLLMEELRAQVQAQALESKQEGAAVYTCRVADSTRLQRYEKLTLSVETSAAGCPRAEDLMILSAAGTKAAISDDHWHSEANHRLALVHKVTAEAGEASLRLEVFVCLTKFANGRQQPHPMQAQVGNGRRVQLTHVDSVVAQLREARALVNMHTLPHPLLDAILCPDPVAAGAAAPTLSGARLPQRLKEHLKQSHNDMQLQAILMALDQPNAACKVALIQGPPGSGKTSAIVGILSGLLADNAFSRAGDPVPVTAATGQILEPTVVPAKRVLVCAQSNAAIDELLTRLDARGLPTGVGTTRGIAMLRLGKADAAHRAAVQYHVDAIASERQVVDDGRGSKAEDAAEQAALRAELQTLTKKLAAANKGSAAAGDSRTEGKRVQDRINLLELQLQKSAAAAAGVSVERSDWSVRGKLLRAAELVLCTLSAAGGDLANLLRQKRGGGAGKGGGVAFDAVIIDEAAQAIEPATLIPLYQLSKTRARVILVGDPRQLPPTVLSKAASAASLARSLFERLQTAEQPHVMLTHQYRMHPAIAAFPSKYFYASKLADGVDAAARRAGHHARPCFPPLAFYDVQDGRESRSGGGSIENAEEGRLVVALLNALFDCCKAADVGTCAVITPYRAQANSVRSSISRNLRNEEELRGQIEVATVDAFQGREADVVIFSCVRATVSSTAALGDVNSLGSAVGFLSDVRRMNVALTRARRSLWVIGHARTLWTSQPWRMLLRHTAQTACLFAASRPYSALLQSTREDMPRAALPDAGDGASNARAAQKSARGAEAAAAAPAAATAKPAPKDSKPRQPTQGTGFKRSSKAAKPKRPEPGLE